MRTESTFDPTIVFGPHPPMASVGDTTPTTVSLSFITDPSLLYFDFDFDDVGSVTINGGGLHGCHPYRDIGTLDSAIIGVLPIPGLYQYAIHLEYSNQQCIWLEDQGLCLEYAVIADHAGLFFKELYSRWFKKWPAENRASEEQRKIELYTLCIMVLRYKWVDNGTLLQGWMQQMVFTRLYQLEEMITQQYEMIAHVFD
ncbi:hypothetical protein EDD18DRAFT_1108056 [Armillaria luteobubalina]|uniref:Uncharacterized protein n=1 Tax=Armillaria luteobubalina TaxID=153913 RepID=A0AA39Q103_9AGAR|nr:hypothetical protein EDD18DRAFT_1108056 [Armillaria luteobubalina]